MSDQGLLELACASRAAAEGDAKGAAAGLCRAAVTLGARGALLVTFHGTRPRCLGRAGLGARRWRRLRAELARKGALAAQWVPLGQTQGAGCLVERIGSSGRAWVLLQPRLSPEARLALHEAAEALFQERATGRGGTPTQLAWAITREQVLGARLCRAAHDVKAPLSAMKGYVDMVLRGMAGPLTPTLQRYAGRLREAILRQREVIDSRLRPTLGAREPRVDLSRVVAAELTARSALARGRGIELRHSTPSHPCWAAMSPSDAALLVGSFTRALLARARPGERTRVELTRVGCWWRLTARGPCRGVLSTRPGRICANLVRRGGGTLEEREGMFGVLLPASSRRQAELVRPSLRAFA